MTKEECEIETSKAIMEMRKQIADLKKENAELKEVHESDKRSLALIAKKGAALEKAYNEATENEAKMQDVLQRWYNQHHDKSYTETFYQRLIEDTERLLWSNECL